MTSFFFCIAENDINEALRFQSENFYKVIKHDYDVDPQVCSVMYPIDSLQVRGNDFAGRGGVCSGGVFSGWLLLFVVVVVVVFGWLKVL